MSKNIYTNLLRNRSAMISRCDCELVLNFFLQDNIYSFLISSMAINVLNYIIRQIERERNEYIK